MIEEKQDQPKTFWLQHGSFKTIVVDNENANPNWRRKPFKVIEIHAIELLNNKLSFAENRIAKLSEENSKLNNAKDFLIKYYDPQDTRFKKMIDDFVTLDDEQKNKMINLSNALLEFNK